MELKRIAIVEDQQMFRSFLRAHLAKEFPSLGEVREFGRLADIRAEDLKGIDVLVLDLELPDGNGLDWYEKQKSPPPTVILSTAATDYILLRAFESGAQAYVHKTEHEDVLVLAIKSVLTGSGFLSPVIQNLRRKLQRDPVGFQKILSDREIEVLEAFAQGMSDDETASLLGLKVSSVCDHRKTIMRKIEAGNQTELLRYATRKGFVPAR